MKKEKKKFFGNLFYSYFFTLILILFLIILILPFIKTIGRADQIRKKIHALEIEIEQLESEKINFLETIEYFKTEFYKEKEAREKFGLKQPGEEVIVILPTDKIDEKKEEQNIKKWWQFLFK